MYRNYVVAHILVKVSEWTQLDVVTKVDIFPKVNSLNQMMIKHEIKDKRAILKYGSLVNDIMRLMEAEAITFQKAVPFIPLKDIMIESESTNTGEKIAWSEIKKSIAVNPEIMHFNALEQIHLISVLILFRLVRKK